MTAAGRLTRWNLWYDELPEAWRFQFILWPLLALGAINLLLTIAMRFPFALLIVLGILFYAAVRVPFVLGWIGPDAEDVATRPRFQIHGAPWVLDLNERYDAMPELRRIWVYPAILLVAGAINMILTIFHRFPFGLLFLLVLLALVAIRAPYAAGWIAPRSVAPAPVQDHAAETERTPPPPVSSADGGFAEPDLPPPRAEDGGHG